MPKTRVQSSNALWLVAVIAAAFAALCIFRNGLINGSSAENPPTAGIEGSFVKADGVRLHYVSSGSGMPLILIHGFGAWSYSWRRNMAPLSKNFRVYALDLKGFGFSDKPPNSDYSLEAQAKLVASFMDELGIEKAVVAGNSLGGKVALKLYSMRPERVRGLILIDSTGYFEGPNGLLIAQRSRWIRLAILRTLVLTKWQVKRQLYEGYYLPDKRVTEDIVDGYYLPLKTPEAEGAALAMWDTLRLENETTIIRSVRVPTLIVWGRKDRIVPLSFAYRFKADIPAAELFVVEDAGHAPQEETPEKVNKAIIDFVTAVW